MSFGAGQDFGRGDLGQVAGFGMSRAAADQDVAVPRFDFDGLTLA